MTAAYGPQDKTVRAAYVAFNLQLLGMASRIRVEQIARSLAALGLLAMGLGATVNRDAVRTRLWLEPHHGTEAYLAEVERSRGRLRMRHCRGNRKAAGQAAAGQCPDGWQRIQLN